MKTFMLFLVDMIIRSIIFAVPVAFVANWCGIEPTWKTVAFVAFCIIWSGCVDRPSSSEPAEPSPADKRKTPAEVLTRAQVAAEARKLTQRPLHQG
jgi:hypothetical protein